MSTPRRPPSLTRELPGLLGLALIAGISAWAYPQLPETVPVHWGLDGNPDRLGSKLEILVGLPAVALLVYALLALLPRLDRRNRANQSALASVRTWLVLGLAALQAGLVSLLLGTPISVPRLATLVVGLIFVGTGNVMGKLEPNYLAGIRTRWTLESPRAWRVANRLGGWTMVLGGLLMIAAAAIGLPDWALLSLILLTVLALVATTLPAYLAWQQDAERGGARQG